MEYRHRSVISHIFSSSSVVDNALSGFAEANKGLVLLEGHRILMRREYRQLKQVKIISGGWSSFEPLYIGFVGAGMLTAAVVGDQFCSPPSLSILTAIRELAYENQYGVLIIVMNHPSSKFNFMLAVENAQRENIPVKLLFATDDCSGLSNEKGRKGKTGIIFFYKIAGAMAEQKKSLEEIYNVCTEIGLLNLASISVKICYKPEINFLNKSDELQSAYSDNISVVSDSSSTLIEIIEDVTTKISNVCTYRLSHVSELSNTILGYTVDGTLSPYSVCKQGQSTIAILINNYGFMLDLELNTLIHQLCLDLCHRQIQVERIYHGTVQSSPMVSGFSVTVMKVDESILKYLDYPVKVTAWPVLVLPKTDSLVTLPKIVKPISYFQQEPRLLGPILPIKATSEIRRALEYACMALISCEEQVNKMCTEDYVGYGTNVKFMMKLIMDKLFNNELKVNCPFILFQQLSEISSEKLQGISGTVYATFFYGISQTFLKYIRKEKVTPSIWVGAFRDGIKAIEYYFGIKQGKRSMLDIFYPMLKVAEKSPVSFTEIAEAAELANLSVNKENKTESSSPDPSTHVVALWARAVAEGLNAAATSTDCCSKPTRCTDFTKDGDDVMII